jgi:hypothetical protein
MLAYYDSASEYGMKDLLLPRSCLRLRERPDSRISRGGLFGLGSALAQDLIHDDGAEGGDTDTANGEAADGQAEGDIAHANHAGADGQGDGCRDQVATLREIDPVLNPDATSGDGDQAEEYDGETTQDAAGDGCDQRAELGTEAQQDSHSGGNDEVETGVDARHSHNADVLDSPLLMMSVTRRDREKEIMSTGINHSAEICPRFVFSAMRSTALHR